MLSDRYNEQLSIIISKPHRFTLQGYDFDRQGPVRYCGRWAASFSRSKKDDPLTDTFTVSNEVIPFGQMLGRPMPIFYWG